MKTTLRILTLLLLLASSKLNAQCGLTINYNYLVGPCDTMLHDINIGSITGSTCTSFSLLWENGSTGMYTQLDTGYHYLYVTDCFGCQTIDTLLLACVGWNGTTSIEDLLDKPEFKILPNVSSELINIVTNKDPIERIYIYNTSGQLIKEFQDVKTDTFQINITDFKTGLFFIKIESGANYSIEKFVKT